MPLVRRTKMHQSHSVSNVIFLNINELFIAVRSLVICELANLFLFKFGAVSFYSF